MARDNIAPALTLDYSEWASSDPQTKDEFVKQLREACSGLGCEWLAVKPGLSPDFQIDANDSLLPHQHSLDKEELGGLTPRSRV